MLIPFMDKSWHIDLHLGPFCLSGESSLSADVHNRVERKAGKNIWIDKGIQGIMIFCETNYIRVGSDVLADK